jgi:hypothetical protein
MSGGGTLGLLPIFLETKGGLGVNYQLGLAVAQMGSW